MILDKQVQHLRIGDVISTDNTVIQEIAPVAATNEIIVGGVCHGVWKEQSFEPEHELPVYFKPRIFDDVGYQQGLLNITIAQACIRIKQWVEHVKRR